MCGGKGKNVKIVHEVDYRRLHYHRFV